MERDHHMQDPHARDEAAKAVAHALRPRLRAIVAKQITWSTPDVLEDVAFVIRTRMEAKSDWARIGPWWKASGAHVTAALMDLRGIDEGLASHLVGAAVQAQVTAEQDVLSDSVLRLAEAASVWLDGAGHRAPVTA